MKHECMIDNEWDVEIKCHKCKRILDSKEAERTWDYLKVTSW